ncbi:hypothetical protein H0P51_17260 [Mycobacterium vicinigordonae]|uniref:Schlafen AlbA-2 domain-containing protein n=1 Tax=Mycobacterium vicinigordonae TaxID=1719132 RepID=A0A7D6I986_9MYCO|nr:hypothetical protein H0P51_17260 [Mycobacterium vicinigordonae]
MRLTLGHLDKTRALRTEDELRDLVTAIYNSPTTTQETNWLEWKSALNLSVAEGRFSVAKAILGFANRSVSEAQRSCEGVAYMVVGVEPGNAPGVPTFDHATLGQRVKTYADGPRWMAHYVELADVTVLVIVVEAPRAGDHIHTLQKEFSNDRTRHQAGTVFHRGTAQTQPAGPKELAMLEERLLDGRRNPGLDLEFEAQAEPLTRLSADIDEINDWLNRHEVYVRANSGEPPPPPPPPRSPNPSIGSLANLTSFVVPSSLGGMFGPQSATAEDGKEFNRRVEDYLARIRNGVVDHMVRGVVESDENKVVFTVGNETDDSVTGVKLTAKIPRTSLVVRGSPPAVEPLPRRLPKWPDRGTDYLTEIQMAALARETNNYVFDPREPSVVEKDTLFEATWDIGDLRPREWSDPLTLTIVAGPDAPSALDIELTASSLSHRCTKSWKTSVTVGAGTWTIDNFLDAEIGD